MRRLAIAFLLGMTGSLSVHAEDVNTRVVTMPYSECLAIIDETAGEIGEAPVKLVNTNDETKVRINASDGFVTVSCERSGNRMVLTKSPVPDAAGLTAAR